MRGKLSATQPTDLSHVIVVNPSRVQSIEDDGDVSFSLALSRPCINTAFVALRLVICNK